MPSLEPSAVCPVLTGKLGRPPLGACPYFGRSRCFWVMMVAPRSGVDLPANLQRCLDRMKAMPSVIQAFAEEGLS